MKNLVIIGAGRAGTIHVTEFFEMSEACGGEI